jgi:hypothetical protein
MLPIVRHGGKRWARREFDSPCAGAAQETRERAWPRSLQRLAAARGAQSAPPPAACSEQRHLERSASAAGAMEPCEAALRRSRVQESAARLGARCVALHASELGARERRQGRATQLRHGVVRREAWTRSEEAERCRSLLRCPAGRRHLRAVRQWYARTTLLQCPHNFRHRPKRASLCCQGLALPPHCAAYVPLAPPRPPPFVLRALRTHPRQQGAVLHLRRCITPHARQSARHSQREERQCVRGAGGVARAAAARAQGPSSGPPLCLPWPPAARSRCRGGRASKPRSSPHVAHVPCCMLHPQNSFAPRKHREAPSKSRRCRPARRAEDAGRWKIAGRRLQVATQPLEAS